jgi:hypothetical protein
MPFIYVLGAARLRELVSIPERRFSLLRHIQIGSAFHTAFCIIGTNEFSLRNWGWVKLRVCASGNSHRAVARLKILGATPPLTHTLYKVHMEGITFATPDIFSWREECERYAVKYIYSVL